MKSPSLAGLAGLACLAAHAQAPFAPAMPKTQESVLVTATRSLQPGPGTIRDATVITREELEDAGSLSLAEVLQRHAGIEFRGTGGPGQPQGLFIRGAGTAQSLVLIEGLRAGSATIGTTSIENIPLEMIERIEVVKGPLSSLYGSDAIGGVVQIFTRGKKVPHFFASAGYGEDNDARASAGIVAAEADRSFALSAGARKVDAPSATNPRAGFCHDPDGDPHENAFANLRATQRLWQGETLALEAFATRGKTRFDGCGGADDLSEQTISGLRFSSSSAFTGWWTSRLALGQGRDELEITGSFPSRLETRQDQASWINEFSTGTGTVVAGLEALRQNVRSDEATPFAVTDRDTNSVWAAINETWAGQRLEASARRDDDDQFGARSTGSVSYGFAWPSVAMLSVTWGKGFRAPSFYDLYGPSSDFYQPNPLLEPEQSESWEVSAAAEKGRAIAWRLTGFDNRVENLITYVFPTVMNVRRARIRGVEATAEAAWLGAKWRGSLTAQRPEDEDTGKRLPGRAERFGTLQVGRDWGAWSAGLTVFASGERYDSTTEAPESRLPGYTLVDARVRYAIDKRWSVELTAANLTDKRYESAVGYDAPRRSVFLNFKFEAF